MHRQRLRRTPGGDPAASSKHRPYRSTISLPPELRSLLETRGARSDRGRGPYNFTRQLTRALTLFDDVVEKSDPRHTSHLADDHYQLIVEVLSDPLVLETFHITHLGDYLFDLATFHARTRELAIEADRLRDSVNALPFAEKLHLVQAAQVRHAPARGR